MVVIKSKNDHNKNISDVKEIVKEEEEIEIWTVWQDMVE
jgi:hypothetical protein